MRWWVDVRFVDCDAYIRVPFVVMNSRAFEMALPFSGVDQDT